MNSIDFDICYGFVSKDRFSFLEEKMGVVFPKIYKETIKECDGGYPLRNTFKYLRADSNKVREDCIGAFSRVNDCEYINILERYLNPPEFFPKDLIAFGENGGGDFICFDYRQGKDNPNPPIVFWNHEAEEGKDVSFIAKNFEEFIDMLYEDED
jgi:hypothetical protein